MVKYLFIDAKYKGNVELDKQTLDYCKKFKVITLYSSVQFNLAKIISKLHTININKWPKTLKKYLSNTYINGNNYGYLSLCNSMLRELPQGFLGVKVKNRLNYSLSKHHNSINNNQLNFSVIHGDLRPSNIIINDDKIKIIDWTDARIDLPSHDIAQIFYLFSFNRKQKNIFLSGYKYKNINLSFMNAHLLSIFIYELVEYWLKNNKRNNMKKFKQSIVSIVIGLALAASLSYAAPTANPPNNNIFAR